MSVVSLMFSKRVVERLQDLLRSEVDRDIKPAASGSNSFSAVQLKNRTIGVSFDNTLFTKNYMYDDGKGYGRALVNSQIASLKVVVSRQSRKVR